MAAPLTAAVSPWWPQPLGCQLPLGNPVSSLCPSRPEVTDLSTVTNSWVMTLSHWGFSSSISFVINSLH